MCSDAEEMVTLQVYGQGAWHDEVWIVGNDAGLLEIECACANARRHGRAMGRAFVSDGEGYRVCVMRRALAEIMPLQVPYAEEMTQYGGRSVWLADMWKEQDDNDPR